MTCTTQQIIRLKQMSHKYNKEIAASKSGMSTKTARKYLSSTTLAGEVSKKRQWKTRTNIFEEYWPKIEDENSRTKLNKTYKFSAQISLGVL